MLFRRQAVHSIRFRWEASKCECQCCCDDLRKLGMGIGYEPRASAEHLNRDGGWRAHMTEQSCGHGSRLATVEGQILAAFDRNHFRLFRRRFLASLRGAGNNERVTAVVYGLYPSERRALARERRTEVHVQTPGQISPARAVFGTFKR